MQRYLKFSGIFTKKTPMLIQKITKTFLVIFTTKALEIRQFVYMYSKVTSIPKKSILQRNIKYTSSKIQKPGLNSIS